MKGKVRVTIQNHIQTILDTALMEIGSPSETPSANHLFQFKEYDSDLSTQKQDLYRTLLANILLVSCR